MTREEFFEKLTNGAKWDVGVAINRTNPVPLDANSVFESLDALTTYATTNALAYPGQVVSVLGTEEIAAYLIKTTGEGALISKLAASSASGDISADVETLKTQVANIINGTQVVGEATKATQDGEGNVISTTYATATALEGVRTTAEKGVSDAAAAKEAADAAKAVADAKVGAVSLASGAANGTVKLTVDGVDTEVAVKGLGSAAYTAADAYDAAGKAQELVSAHNVSAEAHADIRQSVTALAEKVSGRATAYVYKNKSDAAYTTAIGKAGSFVVGDTIYFTDTDILDEWVTKVNAAAPYYEFQEIETEKPSFDGYVKGTELTANKIVLGNGGSNIKASTVGVATAVAAADEANLPTNKAVADYVAAEIGKLDVEATVVGAGETIKSISETNGKITVEKQAIAITQSQVAGLADALAGKQAAITAENKLSADLVDGLGAAAKKGVDTAVSATSENLPTSKAVASYVTTQISGKQDNLSPDQLAAVNSGITVAKVGQYDGYATTKQNTIDAAHPLSADLVSGLGAAAKKGVASSVTAAGVDLPTAAAVASYVGAEIGKISIPTVNNAALKDASDAIIFTANASADVKITVIDCGNATGWDA